MTIITDKDKKLMEEIRQDKEAYQCLKNKAAWEHIGLYAVLKEWGDPRDWSRYGAMCAERVQKVSGMHTRRSDDTKL